MVEEIIEQWDGWNQMSKNEVNESSIMIVELMLKSEVSQWDEKVKQIQSLKSIKLEKNSLSMEVQNFEWIFWGTPSMQSLDWLWVETFQSYIWEGGRAHKQNTALRQIRLL